jgi:ferredoxin-NADP reductase/MOSC domain-containing protein YiiM/ferredoxin
VNVGLPRDLAWSGRTVHTGIWKYPVQGRCRVTRLNLQGDGQGDLAGHGGEQRAILVYQIDSYAYWQQFLKRTDFTHGQFGENFTVKGLADDAVCIGDRYQIGSALFEVTQPRVTCYRVGIRMGEPRMPALLVSQGRPGFYLRVLREGDVGGGDEIVKVAEGEERMTVAEVDGLLYSAKHPRDRLEHALRIKALSPGWRGSFEALMNSQTAGAARGNAGLAPAEAAHPTSPGFQRLPVTAADQESVDVLSFTMQSPDGHSLPIALPGQYVVVRVQRPGDAALLFRCYSLSGPPSPDRYRISVKIEPDGAVGNYLREHLHAGEGLDVSSPRGSFILRPADEPVVLLSAGIGATPVLAMLHALAAARSPRQILWIHAARDRQHHPFAAEVRSLLLALGNGRSYICYSRPGTEEKLGQDFDASGRLSRADFAKIGVPRDSQVYMCGPARFMADMKEELSASGVPPDRIHVELFNGGESITPGVVGSATKAPHLPKGEVGTGPLVSFTRSGIAAHWNNSDYRSILELAEACDVPTRWSCRAGVCHTCETDLVSGAVAYAPDPLDKPADGNVLICCSQPLRDVAIDL